MSDRLPRAYEVNGASADGISIQEIAPGDEVVWTLGTCT